MHRTAVNRPVSGWRSPGLTPVLWVLAVLLALPGGAIDLSPQSSSKYRLNLDTTLSWGARWRVQGRDMRLIGLPSGGTAYSVNGDDGNLNFDPGITNNALKATVDVDFAYFASETSSFGVFLRGSAFYDFEVRDGDRERTPLSDPAKDWAGSRAEMLDAYAWWRFQVGSSGGELRLGRQVLNWGESTFIQGGMSSINAVDVAALRVPGAELREAFRPQGMLWGSLDLSSNLSVEGFYQYEFVRTVIDPPGTYFSTNDFAGKGGSTVFIGFGSFPDTGERPSYIPYELDHPYMGVLRAANQWPDDGGQYGIALRLFVPEWSDTEFGFYYMNYHSRLPTVNATTGSAASVPLAMANAQQTAAFIYELYGVGPGQNPQVDALAAAASKGAFIDTYLSTARYWIAYPEDVKVVGLSFNAQMGTSGIALQGEVSHHMDKPFQMDDVELLFAALSPVSEGLAATNQVVPGGAGFSEDILGYQRKDSTQFQFTLTKIWGAALGADQVLLLFEGAVQHVWDMPSKDILRFDGPGTYTSGNPLHAGPGGAHEGKPAEPAKHFADATSGGYRLVGRMVFNNALGSLNLIPRFGWQHDVSGVSPGPGGNFIEGRYAITLGLGATYQNTWQFDVSYTRYGGAGRYNLINDRDFIAASVKYSF